MRWRNEYLWLALFAGSFIAFGRVQDVWRPGYEGESRVIAYLLGIAPNFFPAVGIPALFVCCIKDFMPKNGGSVLLREKKHLVSNAISVLGLTIWEFTQIFSKGHFDPHDVLWTFIGAMCFQLLWIAVPVRFRV